MKFIVQGIIAMIIMFSLAIIVANTPTTETETEMDTSTVRVITGVFNW